MAGVGRDGSESRTEAQPCPPGLGLPVTHVCDAWYTPVSLVSHRESTSFPLWAQDQRWLRIPHVSHLYPQKQGADGQGVHLSALFLLTLGPQQGNPGPGWSRSGLRPPRAMPRLAHPAWEGLCPGPSPCSVPQSAPGPPAGHLPSGFPGSGESGSRYESSSSS